jgi:hypothetical protein
MVALVDASRIVSSRCACTLASRAALAWASFLSAFFAWSSALKCCVTSVTRGPGGTASDDSPGLRSPQPRSLLAA